MLGKHKLYVINPRHIAPEDMALVGSEGLETAELASQGVPLPESFVVTSVAFDDFVTAAGIVDRVAAILTRLSAADPVGVEKAAAEISQLITNANFPNTILQPLTHAYRNLSGVSDKYVEISPSWTFDFDLLPPGYIPHTFTNVRGEASLLYNIKLVWASMFDTGALMHRLVKGYAGELSMGVIVRRSIQAEISGQIYSFDPYTNSQDQIVVEAILGVTPTEHRATLEPVADIYKIDKQDLRIVEKNIIAQEKMFIRKGRSNGEVDPLIEVAISPEWQRRQKLEDGFIGVLSKLASQISQNLSLPRLSATWAIELGKVFITDIQEISTIDVDTPVIRGEQIVDEDIITAATKIVDTVPEIDNGRKAQRVNIGILASEVETMVATGDLHTGESEEETTVEEDEQGFESTQPPIAEEYGLITKIFLDISTLDNESLSKARQFDGVFVDGTHLFKQHKMLPESVIGDREKLSTLVDNLALDLSTIAKAIDPRPILYKFSSFDNQTASEVTQNADSWPVADGCRRFIEDPRTMFVEILALKKAMNIYGVRSVSTILPGPRSEEELVQVKKILSGQNLYRGANNNLIAEIATPVFAYQFDRMDAHLVDGIFIDVQEFALSMLGVRSLRGDDMGLVTPQLQNVVSAAQSSNHQISIKLSHTDTNSITLFTQLGAGQLIVTDTLDHAILEEIREINKQKLSQKGKPGRPRKRLIQTR